MLSTSHGGAYDCFDDGDNVCGVMSFIGYSASEMARVYLINLSNPCHGYPSNCASLLNTPSSPQSSPTNSHANNVITPRPHRNSYLLVFNYLALHSSHRALAIKQGVNLTIKIVDCCVRLGLDWLTCGV